jgi:hypothetical protein
MYNNVKHGCLLFPHLLYISAELNITVLVFHLTAKIHALYTSVTLNSKPPRVPPYICLYHPEECLETTLEHAKCPLVINYGRYREITRE